jgi:hypothetical protein
MWNTHVHQTDWDSLTVPVNSWRSMSPAQNYLTCISVWSYLCLYGSVSDTVEVEREYTLSLVEMQNKTDIVWFWGRNVPPWKLYMYMRTVICAHTHNTYVPICVHTHNTDSRATHYHYQAVWTFYFSSEMAEWSSARASGLNRWGYASCVRLLSLAEHFAWQRIFTQWSEIC